MDKKLLNKTSGAYLLYSVLILLLAAPLFYLAVQRLYISEADDTLRLHKKEFLKYTAPSLQLHELGSLNRFNRNVKIDSTKIVATEQIFYSNYYDTLDDEMEPYREINFPLTIQGKPVTYSEKISLVENEDLLKQVLILFFAISSVLILGLFFITKNLSRKLWKPFYSTLQQIENFEIDKLQTPVFKPGNIEEFNRLNNSITRLIEKNTSIYKSQKEFVENAAHELQTPLAVFQAKIDTLMQRSDVTEPQSLILDTLNESVSRLKHLNKNLLLLSKVEHEVYADKQLISIPDYIQKNLSFFTGQAVAKQLSINLQLSTGLQISANIVLAEVLISNLFLNAIKHNVDGGSITIITSARELTFVNTGEQLPLQQDKLFVRFSKVNPSGQGTGLGLSIIKKIADLNSWEVLYKYQDASHFFSIVF